MCGFFGGTGEEEKAVKRASFTLAALVAALAASPSFGVLSDNVIGGGSFEELSTTLFTADSGQTVADYPYLKHEHSPRTLAEIASPETRPVRAWQFHPEFDLGRWITTWGVGGDYPGDYDGMTGISAYDDPRSYWDEGAFPGDGTWTAPVSCNNVSEDPLNPGNHVMEGVWFRPTVGQIVQAPPDHVAGTATIDFDYYWDNWEDPPTDGASIFHVWVWGLPESDLPSWEDRAGLPSAYDLPSVFPDAELVFTSPNWAEWGWTGPGSDEPEIASLGDQWLTFSQEHPDRAVFEIADPFPYYYVAVWTVTYAEMHPYYWPYGGKPADTFAIGIDNIDLRLQVPEPATLGVFAVAALGLLRRRQRFTSEPGYRQPGPA